MCPLSAVKSDALTTWCAAWKLAQIGFLLKCCCWRPRATWVTWQRNRKGTFSFANICQEYVCNSYRAEFAWPPGFTLGTFACLWMDQTGPEHPSSSFINCNAGRSHISGLWDHEFWILPPEFHATLSGHLPVKRISRDPGLCSETRTHMIPPENCEREPRTKLSSKDQSQTPGFYSEGYSKYWNTEYSKRVRSVYTPLQKTAEFQAQTTGNSSHSWCPTHGKHGGNLRVPSALFKPLIHAAKLYQSPTSVLEWCFMTAG